MNPIYSERAAEYAQKSAEPSRMPVELLAICRRHYAQGRGFARTDGAFLGIGQAEFVVADRLPSQVTSAHDTSGALAECSAKLLAINTLTR